MGWWSAAVLGGDGPCDIQCTIRDMMGLDESFFDRFDNPKARTSKKDIEQARKIFRGRFFMKRVTKMIEDGEYDDVNIGYQVLGVMMMEFGVPISRRLKARIIEAAREDSWAAEQREDDDEEAEKDRIEAMDSFISDLEKYDNKTPTQLSLPDEGLFAKIAKHLAEDKPGLVNR